MTDQWASVRRPLAEGEGYDLGDDVKRDWTLARAKVEAEGRCRLNAHLTPYYAERQTKDGKCDGPIEAAHVVEKRYDDGPTVQPCDIIPLCSFHHARYDARRLSILELLTNEEQAAAVAKLGIIRALKRTTSGTTEAVERFVDGQ